MQGADRPLYLSHLFAYGKATAAKLFKQVSIVRVGLLL